MTLGRGRWTSSGRSQLVQVCGQAGQLCPGACQDGNGSLGAEPEELAAMPSTSQSQLCLEGLTGICEHPGYGQTLRGGGSGRVDSPQSVN